MLHITLYTRDGELRADYVRESNGQEWAAPVTLWCGSRSTEEARGEVRPAEILVTVQSTQE